MRFKWLNGHRMPSLVSRDAFPLRESNLFNPPVLPCPGQTKLGKDHPDTLSSLNNLAVLLHAQGNLAEAEPLFREALEKGPGA